MRKSELYPGWIAGKIFISLGTRPEINVEYWYFTHISLINDMTLIIVTVHKTNIL